MNHNDGEDEKKLLFFLKKNKPLAKPADYNLEQRIMAATIAKVSIWDSIIAFYRGRIYLLGIPLVVAVSALLFTVYMSRSNLVDNENTRVLAMVSEKEQDELASFMETSWQLSTAENQEDAFIKEDL